LGKIVFGHTQKSTINLHIFLFSQSSFGEARMAAVAGGGAAWKGDMLPTKMEVFQHYQYLTEFKNKSGEWHKTTQKCVKAKHVVEVVANVWERGGLPHRLEDSKIVIALLDRVIRMKENQKK
jgi:hypothetical protein